MTTIIVIGNSGVEKATLLRCITDGQISLSSSNSVISNTLTLVKFKDTTIISAAADNKTRLKVADEIESSMFRGGNFKV